MSLIEKVRYVSPLIVSIGAIITISWIGYQFLVNKYYLPEYRLEIIALPEVVLDPDERIGDSLRIFWGFKEVRSLSYQTFIFKNTGREAIRDNDIEQQPQITFAKDIEILRVIPKRYPENLKAVCEFPSNSNTLSVIFGLMNPNDTYEITVILNGRQIQEPEIKARIVNISEIKIEKLKPRTKYSLYYSLIIGTFGLTSILGITIVLLIIWTRSKLMRWCKDYTGALENGLKSLNEKRELQSEKWEAMFSELKKSIKSEKRS